MKMHLYKAIIKGKLVNRIIIIMQAMLILKTYTKSPHFKSPP